MDCMNKEALAMSFYEMEQPKSSIFSGVQAYLDRFASWAVGMGDSYKYARTVAALSSLDDNLLAKMGLTRQDIPQHARKVLQG